MKRIKTFLTFLMIIGLLMMGVVNGVQAQTDDTDDTDQAESMQPQAGQSVWDIIRAQEELSDFATWIQAAGLVDNLNQDGPFTVFAPTNQAMANFEAIAANSSATRTQILLHHIINGSYPSQGIANYSTRPTLLGEQLNFSVDSGQISIDDTTNITNSDLEASNGFVHIVDSVTLPPENSLFIATQGSRMDTINDVLEADGRFTTLLSLLGQAGLDDELNDLNLDYTVFAPTDEAFAHLSETQVNDWLNDQDNIETLLSYHLVTDRLGINQIANDDLIPSSEGRPLFAEFDEDMIVYVNGVPLNEFNVVAANGVIHVVDEVLTP